MAYRYSVLQDQESLDYVLQVLSGIERLFLINNDTGLLARSVAPTNSATGRHIQERSIEQNEKLTYKMIDGEQWVGIQGKDGVSRDQYTGILFGLYAAFDKVDNPDVKARTKRLIKLAINYLIAQDWIISEDRLPFDPVTDAGVTFWAGVNYQKITFLTIGERVSPGSFTKELEESYNLLDTAWLSAALSSIEPIKSYYSFNIFYMNLFSYFSIDKDSERNLKMMEATRITDYYIGHHNNAFFNMVRGVYDKENKEYHSKQAFELLKQTFDAGHRLVVPDHSLFGNIEYTQEDLPLRDEWVTMPVQPIHPALRGFTHFIWQRSPFNPVSISAEDPYTETIGNDISLVYWMLRAEGYGGSMVYLIPIINNILL